MSGTNSQQKSRKKKPFEQLTITDNYMFQAVMRNSRLLKPLLEMIIGKKIREIRFHETEKSVETGYRSRGIRMDVYIEDDENTVYDVEMQASKKRYLGKRFRYYQSAIDVGIVNKGSGVSKLKNSFIIFITTYDPFGKGWYMYPFKTICEWDSSLQMKDESTRIILNTKGTTDAKGHEVSEEIKNLLSYMDGNQPQSEYAQEIDDEVKRIKENENRRLEYMSIYTHDADTLELGRYAAYVTIVREKAGKYPDDMIISFTGIRPETFKNIRDVINAHPDWDDEDVADEVLDMEDEA